MKYLAASIPVIAAIAAVLFVLRAGNNATEESPQPLSPPPQTHFLVGEMEKFTPAPARTRVPSTKFQDPRGSKTSLSAFRGKTILVNFWATWCGPCKREMPSLDRLQTLLGTEQFAVVAVSIDRGGADAVLPFLKGIGVKGLMPYYDPQNALGRDMGALGLPTSVLVDAQGFEIGRLVAPAEWDSREALALIKSYME